LAGQTFAVGFTGWMLVSLSGCSRPAQE